MARESIANGSIDRRRFGAMMAAVGAGMGTGAFAANANPELLHLSGNGWMPNNEALQYFSIGAPLLRSRIWPLPWKRLSNATAGRRNGGMGSMTFITITPPRTRCWDLRAAGEDWF